MRRTEDDGRARDGRARRDVLETTAGIAATGLIAGLAGCLSDTEGTGTGSPVTSDAPSTSEAPPDGETPTAAPGFAATDWLPGPSAVGERDHYGFGVLRPSALAPHADALGRDYYDELLATDGAMEVTGLGPESVTTHVARGPASVFEAAFDADDVAGSLQDADFERTGSHGGFDVWAPTAEASHGDAAVGVGDGVLVAGRSRDGTTPTAAVEVTIDAGVDDVGRYAETSDAASALFDRLSAGQIISGSTFDPPGETEPERGRFAGNTGLGYRVTAGDDETSVRLVFVFESAADADDEAIRQWVDDAGPGGALTLMDDVTVEADGASVTVSGTMDTADVAGSGLGGFFVSQGDAETPQAGASVSADDAENTVRVDWTSNHNADELVVTFDPDGGDVVTEVLEEVGDTVTYEGSDGETVTVTVVAQAGDQGAVILDDTVEL